MKITEYGLWYSGDFDGIWRKTPIQQSDICFNGFIIGKCDHKKSGMRPQVNLYWLRVANAKLVRNAPGTKGLGPYSGFRFFPLGRIPTESDFEVADEIT